MNDVDLETQLAAAAAVPDDAALTTVRDLALRLVRETGALEALRAEVARREKDLKDLAERQLPEKFTAVGITALPLTNGATIEVKPFVGASIEEEKREAAYAWLERVGAGDLVKNLVTLAFGRGEDALATFIHGVAQRAGLTAEIKKSVNYQTLQAWVRDRLGRGEGVDTGVITVYAGQVAKIKLPKGATLAQVLGEKT
jgi:hypothetical protein